MENLAQNVSELKTTKQTQTNTASGGWGKEYRYRICVQQGFSDTKKFMTLSEDSILNPTILHVVHPL